MKLALRLVTAALVAGSAALGFVPVASAADTVTLKPAVSSWYQPNPTCAQASGCITTGSVPALPVPLPDIPLSPYPAGTLHVGYTGGQEVARSYLAFPVDSVNGTVTSASLDIPLDVSAANGSTQPETAKVQACLVSADLVPTEGSIGQPPVVTCDVHAALTYVEKPAPHLHGDLKPLLAGLLTTTGIALLPDNTKVSETDAWRVVFSSPTRTDAAKTAPPALSLAVTPFDEQPVVDVPVVEPVAGPVAAPIVPSGELPGIGAVDVPPAVSQPVVNDPVTAPVQPVAQPQIVTVGYAYPIVWLLPLAFLVLVPAAARALTKDLTPSAP